MAARIVDLIAKKRDGGELADDEIRAVIAEDTPDYQLSAFLMAVVLNGMTEEETAALLRAMVDSGQRIDLSGIDGPVADKHSTGGVGDKTTLVVAPLVAACGVPVAKLSGRGLGHTGGTLDKLESIPGFRVGLTIPELIEQVRACGVAVAAQTSELVPADKRLYALRDVTATVPSIPLIATSIMSKKLVSGATRLVLDVKVGEGAFMRDADMARRLGVAMMRLGRDSGIETAYMLSTMDEPLGRAVGNALEVAEAVETLEGGGPPDLRELCVTAAALLVGDRQTVLRALDSGDARERYERWIRAQGGHPAAAMARAPVVTEVTADRTGWVERCHSLAVGEAAMRLGAGRRRKDDDVDHAVGIVVQAKRGDRVEAGQTLAVVHSRVAIDHAEIRACFDIGDDRVPAGPVVLARVTR